MVDTAAKMVIDETDTGPVVVPANLVRCQTCDEYADMGDSTGTVGWCRSCREYWEGNH